MKNVSDEMIMGKVVAVCISEKKGIQNEMSEHASWLSISDWKVMPMPENGIVR